MAIATKNTDQKIEYGKKYIGLVERIQSESKLCVSDLRTVTEKIKMEAIDGIYNATVDCADSMISAVGESTVKLSGYYSETLGTAALVGTDTLDKTKKLIENLEPYAGIKGNSERITVTRTGNEEFSAENMAEFCTYIAKFSSIRKSFIEDFAAIGRIDTDDNFKQAHMELGKKLETACNTLAAYYKKLETTNADIFARINSASADAVSEVNLGTLNVDSAADAVCKVNRNLNV